MTSLAGPQKQRNYEARRTYSSADTVFPRGYFVTELATVSETDGQWIFAVHACDRIDEDLAFGATRMLISLRTNASEALADAEDVYKDRYLSDTSAAFDPIDASGYTTVVAWPINRRSNPAVTTDEIRCFEVTPHPPV